MASNENGLDEPPGPQPSYQITLGGDDALDPDWIPDDVAHPVVWRRSASKIHRADRGSPHPSPNCWVDVEDPNQLNIADYADIHRHKELCRNRGCWPTTSHTTPNARTGTHKPLTGTPDQ